MAISLLIALTPMVGRCSLMCSRILNRQQTIYCVNPASYPVLKAATICRISCRNLRPIVHPQARLHQAYLAGSDEDRAAAVLDAFADASTTAVICLRGGYGCARILPTLSKRFKEKEGRRDVSVEVGSDRKMKGAPPVTAPDARQVAEAAAESEYGGRGESEVVGARVEEALRAAGPSRGRQSQAESNGNGTYLDSGNGNEDEDEDGNVNCSSSEGTGTKASDCTDASSAAAAAAVISAAAADGIRTKRFFGFSDITALHW